MLGISDSTRACNAVLMAPRDFWHRSDPAVTLSDMALEREPKAKETPRPTSGFAAPVPTGLTPRYYWE